MGCKHKYKYKKIEYIEITENLMVVHEHKECKFCNYKEVKKYSQLSSFKKPTKKVS